MNTHTFHSTCRAHRPRSHRWQRVSAKSCRVHVADTPPTLMLLECRTGKRRNGSPIPLNWAEHTFSSVVEPSTLELWSSGKLWILRNFWIYIKLFPNVQQPEKSARDFKVSNWGNKIKTSTQFSKNNPWISWIIPISLARQSYWTVSLACAHTHTKPKSDLSHLARSSNRNRCPKVSIAGPHKKCIVSAPTPQVDQQKVNHFALARKAKPFTQLEPYSPSLPFVEYLDLNIWIE